MVEVESYNRSAAVSLGCGSAVEQAWQLAQESGSYDFDIVVEQTTFPLNTLSNAGASPVEDTLASQGQVDLFNGTMELTLWQDGSFNPDTGAALRVEDGHTYGRNGQAEWEEIDNVADLFAPGGDPMAFLSGVKNITEGQNSQIDIGEGGGQLSLQLTQYAFEMDGAVFADYMRQQLETRLRDEGSLLAGLNLSTPEIYRTMTGVGEMWIDADGLPARMVVDLDFPASKDRGRMTAVMTSDFSSYDLERLGLASTPFLSDPLHWVAYRLPDSDRLDLSIDAITLVDQGKIASFGG